MEKKLTKKSEKVIDALNHEIHALETYRDFLYKVEKVNGYGDHILSAVNHLHSRVMDLLKLIIEETDEEETGW